MKLIRVRVSVFVSDIPHVYKYSQHQVEVDPARGTWAGFLLLFLKRLCFLVLPAEKIVKYSIDL